MARKPSQSDQIRALLTKAEPTLLDAFELSMDGVKNSVREKEIIDALTRGDIAAAASFINVEPSAFRPLSKAAENVYELGATTAAKKIPRSDGLFRFDVGSPSAAEELRTYSYGLVKDISDEQKVLIGQTLSNGISMGIAPRRTALDLVGRINKITGRREGGVIGLNLIQAGHVQTMRERLASGDPNQMQSVLDNMNKRDKRYDARIKAAIRDGRRLSLSDVDKMIGRYSDRLLQLRGETIARTETMRAFNKGQLAAMQQAISDGKINGDVVVKKWHAFLDDHTRYTHAHLNKKEVGFYEKFLTARGYSLAYPGDDTAPGSETVNCRCWMECKIDYFADLD